jgi:transcriptional regulator with XRE-family HTH domain
LGGVEREEEMSNKELAKGIKRYREAKMYTLSDMTYLLQGNGYYLSPGYVRQLETGEFVPSSEMLEKLAKIFDIGVEELIKLKRK